MLYDWGETPYLYDRLQTAFADQMRLTSRRSRPSHSAWKSRKDRGIPTFLQPRLLLGPQFKPDKSRAKKTGHFGKLGDGYPISAGGHPIAFLPHVKLRGGLSARGGVFSPAQW